MAKEQTRDREPAARGESHTGLERGGPTGTTMGPTSSDRMSASQIGQARAADAQAPHQIADESQPAVDIKEFHERLSGLSNDDLARLPVLDAGAQLEQGSVYFDLNHPERGPFKAIGGDTAQPGTRIISKRETDYVLWNRLVPQDRGEATDPQIDRPQREPYGIANEANLND